MNIRGLNNMSGLNLVDLNKKLIIKEKDQIKIETPKKIKNKFNFDNIFPYVKKQKNMGMELKEKSMFGECKL